MFAVLPPPGRLAACGLGHQSPVHSGRYHPALDAGLPLLPVHGGPGESVPGLHRRGLQVRLR